MKKSLKVIIALLIICVTICIVVICIKNAKEKEMENAFVSVHSQEELKKLLKTKSNNEDIWKLMATIPYSVLYSVVSGGMSSTVIGDTEVDNGISRLPNPTVTTATGSSSSVLEKSDTNDYSTTNIQVENVDEADITKTDGNFIYSLSDGYVIITDVRDPNQIKIASKFLAEDTVPPVDLILYEDLLTVISKRSQYDSNTYVSVYNIKDREEPILEKSYHIEDKYFTSRCINGKLYVISTGYWSDGEAKYEENGVMKTIPMENIKVNKNNITTRETVITLIDLNNLSKDIQVSKYYMDVSNAYVSEHNIYTVNYKYDYSSSKPTIASIFGIKGIFGIGDNYKKNYKKGSEQKTTIYKFEIQDADIKFIAKGETEGKTINQYSMDEKDNHLRIATYSSNGTRVTIFDEKMNKLGQTEDLAKGEDMYASRFIGNKAYLITYQTVDPLFVIDLSDETNPKNLGELKISGYSAYLHPYDENHLIGIGMETTTSSNRNLNGNLESSVTKVVGMKMALFDVSDVSHPKTIAKTVIGDSRTTSAILSNPKALLFSKEKELLAIPVNDVNTSFTTNYSNNIGTMINSYKTSSSNRIGEGYAVYKINLKDGFDLKGIIKHDSIKNAKKSTYSYSSYYNSINIRGMYINNNLFTVSEDEIRVNSLEDLNEIDKIIVNDNDKVQSSSANNQEIINIAR